MTRARPSARCLSFLIVILLLALAGCSKVQHYELVGSPSAPGADATLEVEPTASNNQEIRLEVHNLLPPDRVIEGATFYAVWLRHQDRAPLHIGNLDYDPKSRSGTLTTVTPYKSFELSVRPESSEAPAAPAELAVLRQKVQIKSK